jgi:hypothetical protein
MNNNLSVMSVSAVIPSREQNWTDSVPSQMKRRDPRIWQLAHAASRRAIETAHCKPQSVIAGTALGALDETKNFLDMLFKEGFGSPRNFIASVHNSMAGKIALDLEIPGPNLTVCDSHNSFASAVATAALLDDESFPVLLLIIDEHIPLLDMLRSSFSDRCIPYIKENWEEAAVAFVIDRENSGSNAGIRSRGPVPVINRNPGTVCMELAGLSMETSDRLLFEESCFSFVQPAITAFDLITTGFTGSKIIGSFSPTSKSAAIVEITHA